MRKIQLDGRKIKELRDGRDRAATQKEFAHEIRISERKLRAIENKNTPVSADVAERIASALSTPLQLLFPNRDDGPTTPPRETQPSVAPIKVQQTKVLPRFDHAYAHATSDEAFLFDKVEGNRVLVSHILMALSAETSAYVEELISLLRSATWGSRGTMDPMDGLAEIGLRRRIRELLVLLKGNDVWVYVYDHIKELPETMELQPETARCDYEFQAIIAFGPPGEYGEISVKVPIDRGRPSIIPTW